MNSLRKIKGFLFFVSFLFLTNIIFSGGLPAENTKNKTQPKKQSAQNGKKNASLQSSIEQSMELTLESVINRIIKENFDLRRARYDILKSDSAWLKYQKKYGYSLNGEASGSYIRQPETGSTALMGTKVDSYSGRAGIAKSFSTGTSLSLSYEHNFSKSNIYFPFLPGARETFSEVYKNTLALTLQQSLARNIFGYQDRLTDKNLQLVGDITRSGLINALSALIVEGLIDYWSLIAAEENLKTSEIEKTNMQDLYNVVLRKKRFGLAQDYEVNQYRALLYQSENKVELAKQQLFDARIKLLKNLNLDNRIELKSVTELYTGAPIVDYDAALKYALAHRVDYLNIIRQIQVIQNTLKIAENDLLPDVNLFASVGSSGQDISLSGSFKEVPTFENPQVTVGVRATYMLGNEETKTRVRDTTYELRQARLAVRQMRKDIEDEIASLTKQANITFNIYQNTKRAEQQAELYYRSVKREISRGRFSALALKEALDNYIRSRYATTQTLINYNATLLKLEMAQNKIFSRFNLNIENILQNPVWKDEDKSLDRRLPQEKNN